MRNLQRWGVILAFVGGDFWLHTAAYIFQAQFRARRVCGHQVGHSILGSQIRYGGIEEYHQSCGTEFEDQDLLHRKRGQFENGRGPA